MDPLIEDFLDDVKGSKSEGTYKARRRDLRRFDPYLEEQGLAAEEVSAKHIHKFLREQGKEYADATVKSQYSTLKLLYDFLAGIWDVIEESPFESDFIERKKYTGNGKDKHAEADIVYVTPEEVEQLCENVGPKYALRDELLIRLLFQTGVRRGEGATIKLDNVDRDAREIQVQDSKDPEKRRTVYYRPSLDFLLDQWIDAGYRDAETTSDYLFPTNESEQISVKQLNPRVRRAARRADIQEVLYEDANGRPRHRITTHALRHGHAVEALKSGIDTKFIQEHMGHEKLETTEKYLRVIDEDVKDAYRQWGTRTDEGEA